VALRRPAIGRAMPESDILRRRMRLFEMINLADMLAIATLLEEGDRGP